RTERAATRSSSASRPARFVTASRSADLEPSCALRETRSVGHSFDEAFAAEFALLHRYRARRVGTSAADELSAETFAVAFRNWELLDPVRPVRPWLYGIAANLMRHHWRKE